MVAFLLILSTLFAFSAPVLANPALEPVRALVSRQTTTIDSSDIPSACIDPCANVEKAGTDCTNSKCICADNVAKDLEVCLTCVAGFSNDATDASSAQEIADTYLKGCKSQGFNLKPIKIKSKKGGASRNGTISSAVLAVSAFVITLLSKGWL